MKKETVEKLKKLRERYPAMFSHPELRPGEICLGEFFQEAAEIQADIWRKKSGVSSIRVGRFKTFHRIQIGAKEKSEIAFFGIFVLIEEVENFL